MKNILPFALLVAFACTPGSSTQPNSCINTVAGLPDGSINVVPSWTIPCDAGTAPLRAAVDHFFGDAGGCQQDSDCVFLTDAGSYSYDNYIEGCVAPVALPNVEGLTQNVESIIEGYQYACGGQDAGAPGSINVGLDCQTPQSELCLTCVAGQCVGNLPIPDSGS